MENKKRRNAAVASATRTKKKVKKINKSNKILPVIILITIISLICIVVYSITKNKPEEAIIEKLDALSVFDNERTNQSVYLYSDNNGQNRIILNTTLKKESKNKKVYDLKLYVDDVNLKNKVIENLEIVAEKGQIKVGQTVIYKKNVEENEIYMTKLKKAKEEKLEVFIEKQSEEEAVINLKYLDKNNNQMVEKLYIEKNRGICKITRLNLNNNEFVELNLDKVYYKLPENIKWFNLLEDYLAE